MKIRKIPAPVLSLCVVLCVFILNSCGPRKIGYGVLLWSPEETAMKNGSVLPVYEESRLKRTYTIPAPDTPEGMAEIEIWRLQFFPKQKDAETFAEEFAEVKGLYAISNRNALPIREKADRLSPQVYRLRLNETMKILELSSVPSDENGLEGFWYKVLTAEGETGYCFNYYLTLHNTETDTAPVPSRDSSQETIEVILTSPWRPEYFRDMVNSEHIDLGRFRSSYGLFFDDEPRQIRIVLPAVSAVIPFSRIRKTSGNTYIAEGSDAQMTLRADGTEIAVSYTQNTNRRTDIFVVFKQDAEEIISREQDRRRNILETFLRGGKTLYSSAYGEIIFSETGTGDFTWTGFNRLVPGVIPREASNTGRAEFSVFIGREVRDSYDGVITFRFSGSAKGINFFYRFTAQGIQLIHIPPENIEDNLVFREALNPLVLFFTPS